MGRYKKREILHFGIDYVKVHVKSEGSQIYGLSRNSSYIIINEELSLEIIDNDKYSHYGVIKNRINNTSIAFFGIGSINFAGEGKQEAKKLEFFEITGQGLMEFNLSVFFDLMEYLSLKFIKYIRFDICLDLNMDINYFYNTIINKYYKRLITELISSKINDIETIYIGHRKKKTSQGKKLNNWEVIRIYNKILDSERKGKIEKYRHIRGDNINVTRIELEVRSKQAKNYPQKTLLDNSVIVSIIEKKIFRINKQFFSFIHHEDFENIEEKIKQGKNKMKQLKQENFNHAEAFDGGSYTLKEAIECFSGYYKKIRTILSREEIENIMENIEYNIGTPEIRDTFTREKQLDFLVSLLSEKKNKKRN